MKRNGFDSFFLIPRFPSLNLKTTSVKGKKKHKSDFEQND